MMRPVVIAILLMSLIATELPIVDTLAHWGRRSFSSQRKGQLARQRRSRRWWRRHRAMLRRKRARALARRRQHTASGQRTRIARKRVAPPEVALTYAGLAGTIKPVKTRAAIVPVKSEASAPFKLSTPHTWSNAGATASGEMKFAVRAADGRLAGTAVLAPVPFTGAPANSVAPARNNKTLGGVPLSSLRRTVIDRMVVEGGWVVNDVERVIAGRRVFVVLAQSGAADASRRSWTFYFTEVDGRVYSLATNSLQEFAEPVATDSEKLVSSIQRNGNGVVAVK